MNKELDPEIVPAPGTNETLEAIAKELGMSVADTLKLAVSQLATAVLPGYQADDGPLTADFLRWLQKRANSEMKQTPVFSNKMLY